MTNFEFYTAIANLENIDTALVDKAQEWLLKDAADKAKAKAKRAEASSASNANADLLLTFLTDTPQTASTLVTAIGDQMTRVDAKGEPKALTSQYIARLAKTLVDSGKAVRADVKVEGIKGTHIGYKIA